MFHGLHSCTYSTIQNNTLMNDKKVLILISGKNARGGINNYFSALRDHLDARSIHYIYRGSRNYPYHGNILQQIARLFADYLYFIFKLITNEYDLIHINMTLDQRGVFRDSIYLLIAKLFRKKVIIFYRGWDLKFQEKIENQFSWIFKRILFQADAKIVLGTTFKEFLTRIGYKKSIFVETTTYDVKLTEGINIPDLIEKKTFEKEITTLLFLSRIEEMKGIFICLEVFEILKPKFSNLKLVYAGDGKDLDKLKTIIRKRNLKDVYFKGFVKDVSKVDAFHAGGIFLFPTYTEGMPNAILEAMAFGLPIITRNVGGIPDIITNKRNGFITESLDPQVFAGFVESLLLNGTLYKEIALKNHQTALQVFAASRVAKRLVNIYQEVLN